MAGELETQNQLLGRFFELTERLTTEVIGQSFAVSTMSDVMPEELLKGRLPTEPELEITTLYRGQGVAEISK